MSLSYKPVTCNSCGWVHAGVPIQDFSGERIVRECARCQNTYN